MLAVLVAWMSACSAPTPHAPQATDPQRPTKTDERPAVAVAATPTPLEPRLFKALAARSIGPALMGGRVSDIAFVPGEPACFYVAFGRGGLMQTSDDGATFAGKLDDQSVSSMGAVAICPADAKTVWVGTGEPNDRNSSGWGDGVYLSTDGGAHFAHVGLAHSKAIGRVAPHPTDARTAYVAALGDLWNDGGERGLYKTTDAGKTWTRVLSAPGAAAARTGCGDVVVDPRAPENVYATLYARRRTPWSFVYGRDFSGDDVGGVFKSSDGGATWKKLGGGLPGSTGRIGLALFPGDPRILYAVVQSDEGGTSDIDDVRSRRGGVFRSNDGGETWTRVNALCPRPFYFSQIRVDPKNAERVYVLGYALHVSEDGGKTFREDRFGKVHPDCHALAIDPVHPERLLLGTDGGVYESWNGGAGWRHVATAAMGEFYRIRLDDGDPYRIAGGLQDNLNWLGPSETNSKEGIVDSDWTSLSGGDGFYCIFDPLDRDVMYAESQSGEIHRIHLKSGAVKTLRPAPAEGQSGFRFHWNSPFIPSAHEPDKLYLAGNRVFALTERGEVWRAISPDLSAQDRDRILTVGSGAETYGVVYTLCESPLAKGMLWAGTDDGKLWLTEDEGGHWTDLTARLPKEALGQWIYRVEAGHHDANVAYLVVNAFRAGNYAPLAWRTEDRGRTWKSVVSNLPPDAPLRVLREDPTNPDLLFVGSEFALHASLDRGASWFEFGELPTCAVDDLALQPREHDLVIATHGRSLWIVDDIGSLASLDAKTRAEPVHLFTPRRAVARTELEGWADWGGNAHFRGANPPRGATIDTWVAEWTGDALELEIATAAGLPVAKLTEPGTPGLHRIVWNLKPTKDFVTEYGGLGDRFVAGGEYTVKLTYGKVEASAKFTVDVDRDIETR
ncbi:MAG: glycosyl hydrolase [Planctomycetes bacterium]|nr:glycosyl hydrolase [Planctomycetota bacterium]